jgi:hypothetical protein
MTEPTEPVVTTTEPTSSQPIISTGTGSGSQLLPEILVTLDDQQLSKAHELTSAMKAFRDGTPEQTPILQLQRVAPGFQGQILDFTLDSKFLKIFTKESPDAPDGFTIPSVKESDTIYPRDAMEAKALDGTLTEASNRLLSACSYLLEVLYSIKDDTDQRLTECVFRALCLTASTTSMLEVERLLRPGDRPSVRDQTARYDMPRVIQEVRRSRPLTTEQRSPEERPKEKSEPDDEFKLVKKKGPTTWSREEPPLTPTYDRSKRRPVYHPGRQSFTYRQGPFRGGQRPQSDANRREGPASAPAPRSGSRP